MPERAERSMNIGDSLPMKLNLVSTDGPNPENPMKTGCLTDSCSEPLSVGLHQPVDVVQKVFVVREFDR